MLYLNKSANKNFNNGVCENMKKYKIIFVLLVLAFLGFTTNNLRVKANQEKITLTFIAKQEEGLYPYLNPREMPENLIVNKGFKIYHLGVPFDDVYSFNGWYYLDNEEEKLLKRDDIFYQDTTFYAKWIVTPKRVQYHLDGGINHFNPTIIYGDQAYDLKGATKLGYDFVGWYNNANFDGNPLMVIPIKSLSMELYAKYIVKDYNIFYHSNEGVHYNQDSYNIESETIELLSAEKFGYTFDGWYDNQEFFGDAITSIQKGSTGDKTLYAKYVEKEDVMVSNELELRAALNLSHVKNINFSSDITLSNDLVIERALNIETNEFQFDFNDYKLEFIQTLDESTYQLKGTFLSGVVILDNSNGHFDLEGLVNTTANIEVINTSNNTAVIKGNWNDVLVKTNSGKTNFKDSAVINGVVVDKGLVLIGGKIAVVTINGGTTTIKAEIEVLTISETADVTLDEEAKLPKYEVKFYDENETQIGDTQKIKYGSSATAPTPAEKTGYRFVGWDKNIDKVTSNLEVFVNYEINQYTIRFVLGGDLADIVITQDYDTTIITPTDFERAGYKFIDWGQIVPKRMPAENRVITAEWQALTSIIYFDSDGGTAVNSLVFKTNEKITLPFPPTKDGYKFVGWDPALPEFMPPGHLYVKAVWEAQTYTLTVNIDGVISEFIYAFNEEIDVSTQTEKIGYEFIEWEPAIPVVMPASDLSVVAKFRVIEYTITFDVDGGNPLNPITKKYDEEIGVLPTPVKTGHEFDGWQEEIPINMPANDLSLTALWQINSYNLVINIDGTITKTPYQYGEKVTTPNIPTKDGYTFDKWLPYIPNTMPANDFEITAKFNPINYVINFDTDGGTAINPIVQAYESKITIPDPPTKEGYTFDDWSPKLPTHMPLEGLSVKATYTKNSYNVSFIVEEEEIINQTLYFGDTITPPTMIDRMGYQFKWDDFPTVMPANDLEISGSYNLVYYSITYNDLFGTTHNNPTTYTIKDQVILKAPSERDGYEFIGWYQNGFSVEVIEESAENINLVAVFTKIHTVIFNSDLGSDVPQIFIRDGQTVTKPSPPTKKGYEFLGWFEAEEEFDFTTPITRDIILVGKWKPAGLFILSIGNSFTDDSFVYQAEILKSAGIERFVIAYLYYGGTSLSFHLEKANNDESVYAYRKFSYNGAGIDYTVRENTSLSYAMNDGDWDWDYITVQQVSQDSGMPNTIEPTLTQLIQKIESINSNPNTQYGYHMTWAYSQTSNHGGFGNYNNNQLAMYNAIVSTTRNVVEANQNIDFIIPSGTAIQNARSTVIGDTLTRDGYHLNDFGKYIAALTWVKTIAKVDITDVAYFPAGYNVEFYLPEIKQAVNDAFKTPYKITYPWINNQASYQQLIYTYQQGFWNGNVMTTDNSDTLVKQFIGTQQLSREQLPLNSKIVIADGYRIRIAFFYQKDNEIVQHTRSENYTKDIIILDESVWKDYDYLAFNISRTDGADIRQRQAETANNATFWASQHYQNIGFTYTLGYWFDNATTVTTGASGLAISFLATETFSKEQLPVGSIVTVASGYKARIIYFNNVDGVPKVMKRSGDINDDAILVTDEMWASYQYIAFNISEQPTEDIKEKQVETAKKLKLWQAKNYDWLSFDYDYGYWLGGSEVVRPTTDNADDFARKFLATNIISIDQLPSNSKVVIENGYRIRMVYFVERDGQLIVDYRTENILEKEIIMDANRWGHYQYVAFNISKADGSAIAESDKSYVASQINLWKYNS